MIKIRLIFLMVVLLTPSALINMPVRGINGIATNQKVASPRAGIYIDPMVGGEITKEQIMFVVFRDHRAMHRAIPSMSRRAKILYRYRIIPAVLVESRPVDIISLDTSGRFIAGIYANRILKVDTPKVAVSGAYTSETAEVIGATTFWSHGYRGDGIKICVVDTGINSSHPELEGKVVKPERSFVLRSLGYPLDETSPMDVHGHGTMVAGIIAGKGIDPRGQGMAPQALIMNARVMSGSGIITYAGIIAAIEWATYGEDGIPNTGDEADIINLSLGAGQIYSSPTWLAIEKATKMGMIVVCAAGNEGDNAIGSMSINDPANAPHAIAVGAASPYYESMEYYSSFGPTIYMAVKPDIVAPSDVYGLDYISGGYTSMTYAGTSFSAPHVSGGLALILEYLRSHNVSKNHWPEIARALIMYTASKLYESKDDGIIEYEDMMIGAGLLNLTRAYIVLNSTTIDGTAYPQWIVVLPKKLPVGISNSSDIRHGAFFPYFERIFVDQTIVFNFSLVMSKDATISISFSGNITDAIDINSPTSVYCTAPITYWEFNMTVKCDTMEGFYSGEIIFEDTDNGNVVEVPIKFSVAQPKIRVLWDMRHTSWSINYVYGQFRFFSYYLEMMSNVSIDMVFPDAPEISMGKLYGYDMLVCFDPASPRYIFSANGSYEGYYMLTFSRDEIESIHNYVESGGTLLLVITQVVSIGYKVTNITNINDLLRPYGMSFNIESVYIETSQGIIPVPAEVYGGHIIGKDIEYLPFAGVTMNIDSSQSECFLTYESKSLAGVYFNINGGGVIAIGSNFIFDNWAYLGLYSGSGSNGENVKRFARNIVDLVYNHSKIISGYYIKHAWLGENITVRLWNSSRITRIEWEFANMFNVSNGTATYNRTGKYWEVSCKASVAGSNILKLRAYISTRYVAFAHEFNIPKSEENKPTIMLLNYKNNTVLDVSSIREENMKIELEIKDDTGIVRESVNITIRNIKYTVQTEGTQKDLHITITISRQEIEQYIAVEGLRDIVIRVSCYDVNLNRAEETYIITLKYAPKTWIIVVIAIVIIIAVIAIIIWKIHSSRSSQY